MIKVVKALHVNSISCHIHSTSTETLNYLLQDFKMHIMVDFQAFKPIYNMYLAYK